MQPTPQQRLLAERIDRMAQSFLDDATGALRGIKAPPELRRIVLEALARKALRAASAPDA
jgi:hypothetical protein